MNISFIADILKANDELTVVINNYKKVMGVSAENGSSATSNTSKCFFILLRDTTQRKVIRFVMIAKNRTGLFFTNIN